MKSKWKSRFFSAGMLYFENAFRLVYSISILFLLRPLLSPYEFAGFAFYLSLAAILYSCAKFSLDSYGIRDLVLLPFDKGNDRLASFLLIRSIAAVILCLIFSAICSIFFYRVSPFFLLLIAQAIRSIDSVEWRLRVDGDHWLQATARIAGMTLALIIILIARKFTLSLTAATASAIIVTEWILTSTIFALYLKLYLFGCRSINLRKQIKPALFTIKEALPMYTSHLLTICYSRLDQLILAPALVASAYGNYMLAARINDALVIVIMSINMIIAPILVRQHEVDLTKFSRSVRLVSLGFFLISIIIILSIWTAKYILERDLIPFISADFMPRETMNWLCYFSLTTIVTFSMGLRSTYFTIVRRPLPILIGGILGAAFTCTVGIYLMHTYKEVGGIISVIGSTFFALFLSNFFTKDGRAFLLLLLFGKSSQAVKITEI